mmetsp:Transcript_12160/g.20953  ORF Transcript_12160/g.20953 Transcript_12160/m.20953 type:complete len:115 (-) Transcript_12160:97-441(-)
MHLPQPLKSPTWQSMSQSFMWQFCDSTRCGHGNPLPPGLTVSARFLLDVPVPHVLLHVPNPLHSLTTQSTLQTPMGHMRDSSNDPWSPSDDLQPLTLDAAPETPLANRKFLSFT